MSLLQEIQAAVIEAGTAIGPILLKLRLLASRLGSEPLEAWVKHESEGYPEGVEVPDYRILSVSYTGTFSGPFGSGIQNAPIPTALIKKYAGDRWVRYEMRQGVAAIDDLLANSSGRGGTLTINASNLILLLQGKVYEDYACNAITGSISRASLAEIQHAIRSRVLELTIGLENSVPASTEIGPTTSASRSNAETVTQIYQQIVYGDVTTISSSGADAKFHVTISKGDDKALADYLVNAGITESDANEIAAIIASEEPESSEEPFGVKAKAWIAENIKKAANGAWNIGVTVATKVLTEAALKYYGLKSG